MYTYMKQVMLLLVLGEEQPVLINQNQSSYDFAQLILNTQSKCTYYSFFKRLCLCCYAMLVSSYVCVDCRNA